MADVAAGLLASAIIGQVGAKIGSAIGDQVSMLCCFKDDMEDMKETLKAIGATMKDAEKRSIKEEEVRLWMKRLKNAALDISDMSDELHENSKPTNGKVLKVPCPSMGANFCSKLGYLPPSPPGNGGAGAGAAAGVKQAVQ